MEPTPQIPFLSLKGLVEEYGSRYVAAFGAELEAATFVQGPSVKAFEEEFAAYLGVAEAVGVSNGLDALSLALTALDIGAGDEIIVPTNSFVATALAVTSVGAKPVLVDCGSDHLIDPSRIGASITSRTRAIIPVHLFGHPAAMNEIVALSRYHNLEIIEDAAQAHGARYHDRCCGTLGRVGCFSFYPTKNLGALGDGGAVVCQDRELTRRVRSLSNYGKRDRDTHVERGGNKRLDSLQAAFLRVALSDLARKNRQRQAMAKQYLDALAACPGLGLPRTHVECEPVWHLFVVRHRARDELRRTLSAAGIETLTHYLRPIHIQPAYADLGYNVGDFPVAENLSRTMLSLPFHPWLKPHEVRRILEAVRSFCETNAPAQSESSD